MAEKNDQRQLIRAAAKVRGLASAPYSKFKVGAALLTQKGEVITGVNVESASYGLTCCAERVALFKALSEGARNFVALAIVAPVKNGPMPCGACRQVLFEFAPELPILLVDVDRPGQIVEVNLRELLPGAFRF